MIIYKANRFYFLPILFVPLLAIVPLLEGGIPLDQKRLVGYLILSGLSVLLAVIPFFTRLEVGADSVKNYFLGLCTSTIKQEDVVVINYGNLLRGGLGYGKGLNIKTKKGLSKSYSVGEKFWGREAVMHAYNVLAPGKVLEIDEEQNKLIGKEELKGGIGIAVSVLFFFAGLGITDSYPSFLKFIIPISALSILGWIIYIVVKSRK